MAIKSNFLNRMNSPTYSRTRSVLDWGSFRLNARTWSRHICRLFSSLCPRFSTRKTFARCSTCAKLQAFVHLFKFVLLLLFFPHLFMLKVFVISNCFLLISFLFCCFFILFRIFRLWKSKAFLARCVNWEWGKFECYF